jgi:hypothetical protein
LPWNAHNPSEGQGEEQGRAEDVGRGRSKDRAHNRPLSSGSMTGVINIIVEISKVQVPWAEIEEDQ